VVYANGGTGNRKLQDTTNESAPGAPQATDPVLAGSLGLSVSGHTVYWISDGTARSATLG
jgi:hypothetical protein